MLWSSETYKDYLKVHGPQATSQNAQLKGRLLQQFPLLHARNPVIEVEPFVLCNVNGNILIWYLPSALQDSQQVSSH